MRTPALEMLASFKKESESSRRLRPTQESDSPEPINTKFVLLVLGVVGTAALTLSFLESDEMKIVADAGRSDFLIAESTTAWLTVVLAAAWFAESFAAVSAAAIESAGTASAPSGIS